ILDRRLFPFNVPGIMGNGTVSPAVKSELERMFREPVLTPVGTRKLNHLNKERLGARRSEVRSVGANVQAIVLMAAILMGGVYPSRAPRDVVAAELANKSIPAVTVTARPDLTDRIQERLDGLDEVRASLAELATANLPLQVVNDFQDGPKAQDFKTKDLKAKDLLELVLLAQQLPSLKVAITIQGMTPAGEKALRQSLRSLAQRKLGVSLDGLTNFRLSFYGMDQSPADVLGGYLGVEVPTVILSNNKDTVDRRGFLVGEAVVESRLRVFVDEEPARGGAVWAAISAFLDQKTLDALDRSVVLTATSLVGKLTARLQEQLKALRAFMSAA
ncbi:MAG: hypothetical protein KBC91_07125, partial [Candidatus Omnitrophica bacterium]|nr:hypothetical protein [Candidatus Omnitrophota bacterium]